MNEPLPIVALPSAEDHADCWRGLVETVPLEPFMQCHHQHDRGAQANTEHFRTRRRSKGLDPDLCGRPARIRMGGHLFCAMHAGSILLDLALSHAFERERP